LHYSAPISNRHEYPISAIPHDTPRYPLGPTALPGVYKVRLTVDDKSLTAQLTVKMDPRVKTSAVGLQRKFSAESRLASIVSASTQAIAEGESIRQQLEAASKKADSQAKDAIDALQAKLTAVLGAPGGFVAPPSDQVTLARLNSQASALYQQIWQADVEPTSSQTEILSTADRDANGVLARWNELKSSELPSINRTLRQANAPEVQVPNNIHPEESQIDEE
jgi:hypothetical protein